jgi:CRISPR/Cas system-associated exonuclease Cas4 (RecB family)
VLEKTKKCIDSAKERGEHIDFKTIFEKVKPAVIEGNFRNEELQVRGFIDYIEHTEDGKVRVMDYKTSKKFQMTPAYRLQLAIYALMYKEKYGKHADKVGLFILKHGEKTIDVDDALVEEAKVAIEDIHYATESNEIKDYPKNITPLCKWSTGQCDFYDTCMKQGD